MAELPERLAFALVRVDDRLLHGQVVVNWVRVLRPHRIAVVLAPAVAGDQDSDLSRQLLWAAAPPGVAFWVGGVEQLMHEPWLVLEEETASTLLLLPGVAEAAELYALGVHYGALNLGSVAVGPGRQRLARQVALSTAEAEVLRSLEQAGVVVTIQALPSDRAQPLALVVRRNRHRQEDSCQG